MLKTKVVSVETIVLLITFAHFTIICALEVISVYVSGRGTLYKCGTAPLFPTLHAVMSHWWLENGHIGHW